MAARAKKVPARSDLPDIQTTDSQVIGLRAKKSMATVAKIFGLLSGNIHCFAIR
ncbi:hypothetical protein [Desulfobacter latus]|uniref:Uncharacterized protein n=1 Tax=Desulfobacter latus TaxID=2292 RepID=A0A850TG08_9BACT|nr:hypothetical protein [Desulfobacter latus]NWH06406.1 hypothetical protein [Desulfobacter latus]